MGRFISLGLAVLLAVACGSDPESTTTTAPEGEAISGTFVVVQAFNPENPTCEGHSGADDITEGANVVAKDGEGNVIGTGALSVGVPTLNTFEETTTDIYHCHFTFEVPLSETADFYTLEVAGRGGPVYSHAEMESMGWTVELFLGG